MTMSSKPLLMTENLTKRFGSLTAVDSINFTVNEGKIHFLIGPNGAGKSTLIKTIIGQLSPTEGQIYFRGETIREKPIHQRINNGISVKFQSPKIYTGLSVAENLEIPALQADRNQSNTVQKAVGQVGLSDFKNKLAGDLSHGQQQRLEIGMALVLSPKLMILDEPTAGMSVEETEQIGNLIQSYNDDGTTFLIIEHNMDFVRQVSQKVTVLNEGAIFREGTIDEIESDDGVRKIYLGEEQ